MDDQTSLTVRRVARRGLTRGATLLSAAAVVGAMTTAGISAADPSPSAAPVASAAPSAVPGATPRVIELYETSLMQILDADGKPVSAIAVQPGETVEIVVGNQARFAHNLAIGPMAALEAGDLTGLPAVEPFTGGSRTITWTVPQDVSDVWFGCTVVGHLSLMQGRFVAVAETMPDVTGTLDADATAQLAASGLLTVERITAADASVPAGTVIAQAPAAGEPVDPTTVVQLTIAADPSASPAA